MARIAILESVHDMLITDLSKIGKIDVMLGLAREELLSKLSDYEVLVVKSVTQVDAELIAAAVRLKVIARAGTGTENIDLEVAARRDIAVFSVPTGNTISAAEYTVGQILALCHRLHDANNAVRVGDYRRHLLMGRELAGSKVAVIGIGNVGIAVSKRLAAHDVELIGYDPYSRFVTEFEALGGTLAHSLEEAISDANIITLHVRLTDKTRSMLNKETFAFIKKGAFLVNSSRGGAIDQEALIDALNSGVIAAAALDVITPEPPYDSLSCDHSYANPLLKTPGVVFTPHIAASTEEAQRRIAGDLSAQIRNFFVEEVSALR